MTLEELLLLDTPQLREAVEANIERDPFAVALDKRLPHAALVATQVKYLQRARRKLPAYYRARAIIPSLAFEQSSSEEAAGAKRWHGSECLDLTCGLGVDTMLLASSFDKVTSIERDPVLAEAARRNFARMGITNVDVICAAAEEFVAAADACGLRVDLIYADPDRRSTDGRKLVLPGECSPNVTTLLPALHRMAGTIAFKLSPLFDVAEAFRIFGSDAAVEAVSLGGECKEVLVESGETAGKGTVAANVIGIGRAAYPADEAAGATTADFAPPYHYLFIPDAALRKARIVRRYAVETMPGSHAVSPEGYVFTDNLPIGQPLGHAYRIVSMERYDPARLRKSLRNRGIRSLKLHVHNFPVKPAGIIGRLGIKEGDAAEIAFIGAGGELWAVELTPATPSGDR